MAFFISPPEYQKLVQKKIASPPICLNCLKAFLVGGLICLLGQAIQDFFLWNFDFTEKTVGNPAAAMMILLAVIFTGLGWYDHLAQWAGAGTAVPVTGFANSISSAAIEYRSEGLVLGTGSQMFKLAGSVIVFGVVAAFGVALIKVFYLMLVGG